MKIYRGPSTKTLDDSSHELVSSIDTERSATFVNGSVVLIANVTKEPIERQAVAHLELDSDDVLALQRRMLTGLLARSAELDRLKERTAAASKELYRLYESLVRWFDEDDADPNKSLLVEVCDVVGTLASELDDRGRDQRRDA
jgi:hypothetical protein